MLLEPVELIFGNKTLLNARLLQRKLRGAHAAASQESVNSARLLTVPIAIQHRLNVALKHPVLRLAWGILASVHKSDNGYSNSQSYTLTYKQGWSSHLLSSLSDSPSRMCGDLCARRGGVQGVAVEQGRYVCAGSGWGRLDAT